MKFNKWQEFKKLINGFLERFDAGCHSILRFLFLSLLLLVTLVAYRVSYYTFLCIMDYIQYIGVKEKPRYIRFPVFQKFDNENHLHCWKMLQLYREKAARSLQASDYWAYTYSQTDTYYDKHFNYIKEGNTLNKAFAFCKQFTTAFSGYYQMLLNWLYEHSLELTQHSMIGAIALFLFCFGLSTFCGYLLYLRLFHRKEYDALIKKLLDIYW